MRFSDLPIQRKLLGSVVLAVTVAAVALVLAIALYETTTFRPRFVGEARSDASMLADLLVPALEFDDARTAGAQLASLERRSDVAASAIYLADGSRFALRERRPGGRFVASFRPSETAAWIDGQHVVVVEAIKSGDRPLGWLCLELDLPGPGRRLYVYGIFGLAAVVSLGVLAVLLSLILRRAVSTPVVSLMEAAQAVSEKKDYSLRVPVTGRDELGRLAEAFNDMLAVIGVRDAARHQHELLLARHNSGLVDISKIEAAANDDAERQLGLFLRILSRVHRVGRVAYWAFDEDGLSIRCVAGYDRERDRDFSGEVLAAATAPDYFEALRSATILAIADTATDPLVAGLRDAYLRPQGVTALLDLPVRRHGELVGVLCHEHTEGPRPWFTQEINFATAVADRVVIILESDVLRAARLALRESEARYREIVEAAPDAIFTISREGFIRQTNAALARLTGWPEEQWREKTLADAVLPEDRAAALQAFASVSEGGGAEAATLRLLRADGGSVTLECFLAPRLQTAGPGAVLCVGRDQTERLNAREVQARLEDQLRHAQKMEAVGTLAGGIAHDFNNILTALLGNLELMGYELPKDHATRPYLANSLQATKRARDLVRQILTFSRRQEAHRRPVKIESIAAEALGLLRASLPSSIQIVSRYAPGTPPVLADETQIHQVIVNLATNAFHAMEPAGGSLSIEVETGRVDEADRALQPQLRVGEYVVLTVGDTGCGMDETTKLRLFEPFFTTKGPGRGTGLGMAVVHGILQAHEAMIAVRSAPGQGTTLRIYFPCWREGVETKETPSKPQVIEASGESPVGRVLVVDDEAPVAYVAELMLKREGFWVRVFNDAQAAMAEFEAQPDRYDLVITDLTMPRVSGLDIARKVRSLRPAVPVIVMTGYGGDHHAEAFANAGVTGLVQKPFTFEVFLSAVKLALARGKNAGA